MPRTADNLRLGCRPSAATELLQHERHRGIVATVVASSLMSRFTGPVWLEAHTMARSLIVMRCPGVLEGRWRLPARLVVAVLALRLRPRGVDRPHCAGRVALVRRRGLHLTGSRRRQHQKLKCQRDGRLRRSRRPDCRDGRGHVLVRQRLPVRHDVILRIEHWHHSVARNVVPEIWTNRPRNSCKRATSGCSRRRRTVHPAGRIPDFPEQCSV